MLKTCRLPGDLGQLVNTPDTLPLWMDDGGAGPRPEADRCIGGLSLADQEANWWSVRDFPLCAAPPPAKSHLPLTLESGQDLLDELRAHPRRSKDQICESEAPHLFHHSIADQFGLGGSGRTGLHLAL